MNWRSRFRDVIWTSVVAAGCGVISVVSAIAGANTPVPIAFGLAGLIAVRLNDQ